MPESLSGFVFVNKDEQNSSDIKQGGPWWRPAMQVFTEISTWIAGPIILAVVGGKALDTHFDTKPTLMLILSGLAFLISGFGIIRTTKKYAAKMKKDSELQK